MPETISFGDDKPATKPTPTKPSIINRNRLTKLSYKDAKKLLDSILTFEQLLELIDTSDSLAAEQLQRKFNPRGKKNIDKRSNKNRYIDTSKATLDLAKELILNRLGEFYGKTTQKNS